MECKVIGTEISDTYKSFPNTIRWDFNEVKEEWLGNVDFIYSNSIDHSYKPKECLNNWIKCLKDHGLCILEHSSNHSSHNAVRALDPFISDLKLMPYLILKWSEGKFGVKKIIKAPKKIKGRFDTFFLIISKF